MFAGAAVLLAGTMGTVGTPSAGAQVRAAAPVVVSNLNDSGPGSLRQAIDQKASPIRFATGLSGTILLTSGQLTIRSTTAIEGPGSGVITVSGNTRSRVFEVAPNVAAQITGLTITKGLNRGSDESSGEAGAGVGGGILNGAGATLTLSGVVVTNNRAEGGDSSGTFGYVGTGGAAWGGGIRNLGALNIQRSLVTNNTAKAGSGGDSAFYFGHGGIAYGGGVANTGTLEVLESTMTKNASIGGNAPDGRANDGHGGGVYSTKDLVVYSSTVSGNTAKGGNSGADGGGGDGFGGGIETNGANGNPGDMTIQNSTVSDNVADSGLTYNRYAAAGTSLGGGIYASGPSTASRQVIASTISGNQALGGDKAGNYGPPAGDGRGGGIFTSGLLTLGNSTIDGNLAKGGSGASGIGGGAYNDGTLYLRFVTVTANRASQSAGSVFSGGNAQTAFGNTIVAGGSPDNCAGREMASQGYNLEQANSCKFAAVGDKPNTDPKLGPLAKNGGPTQTTGASAGKPCHRPGQQHGRAHHRSAGPHPPRVLWLPPPAGRERSGYRGVRGAVVGTSPDLLPAPPVELPQPDGWNHQPPRPGDGDQHRGPEPGHCQRQDHGGGCLGLSRCQRWR